MVEVVSKRTEYSKTYKVDNAVYRRQESSYPLHYWDGSMWQDLDAVPTEHGDAICFDHLPFAAVFPKQAGQDPIEIRAKDDSYGIQMNFVPYKQGYSINSRSEGTVQSDKNGAVITYDNIVETAKLEYKIEPSGRIKPELTMYSLDDVPDHVMIELNYQGFALEERFLRDEAEDVFVWDEEKQDYVKVKHKYKNPCQIRLYNKEVGTGFHIDAPIYIDAKGHRYSSSLRIVHQEDEFALIALEVPKHWMENGVYKNYDVAFPIVLDPTTTYYNLSHGSSRTFEPPEEAIEMYNCRFRFQGVSATQAGSTERITDRNYIQSSMSIWREFGNRTGTTVIPEIPSDGNAIYVSSRSATVSQHSDSDRSSTAFNLLARITTGGNSRTGYPPYAGDDHRAWASRSNASSLLGTEATHYYSITARDSSNPPNSTGFHTGWTYSQTIYDYTTPAGEIHTEGAAVTFIRPGQPDSRIVHSGVLTDQEFSDWRSIDLPIEPFQMNFEVQGSGLMNFRLEYHYTTLEDLIEPPSFAFNPSVGQKTYSSFRVTGNIGDTGGENPIRGARIRPVGSSEWQTKNAGVGGTGTYSVTFDDLQPETQYQVQAWAQNSAGTTYTNNDPANPFLTWTDPAPPEVVSLEVVDIGPSSARLRGELLGVPSSDMEVGFIVDHLTWVILSYLWTRKETIIFEKTEAGEFEAVVTGLDLNREYRFRATARNQTGETHGENIGFWTTAVAPSVDTSTATNVGSRSATLRGEITSTGGTSSVTRTFQWGTTTAMTETIDAGSGGTGSFLQTLSGLEPATRYYFRAVATNEIGTNHGTRRDFTTQTEIDTPSVSTQAATGIETDKAILHGNLTSTGNENPMRFFQWGTTTSVSNGTLEVGVGGTGSFSQTLDALTDDRLYYFRAGATNEAGTAYGQTRSFRTLSSVFQPSVSTLSASSVGITEAQLNGEVTHLGNADFVEIGFLLENVATTAGSFISLGGATEGTFQTTATSLEPETLYRFRAVAENQAGSATGTWRNFQTQSDIPDPPATVPATSYVSASNVHGISDTNVCQVRFTNTALHDDFIHYLNYTCAARYYVDGAWTGYSSGTVSGFAQFSGEHRFNVNIPADRSYEKVQLRSRATILGVHSAFSYSPELDITHKPAVTTSFASNVGSNRARMRGAISDDGNAGDTLARGFRWGTSEAPTDIINVASGGVGTFYYFIETLDEETLYYYQAYAQNAAGVSYGEVVPFTTGQYQPNFLMKIWDGSEWKARPWLVWDGEEWTDH